MGFLRAYLALCVAVAHYYWDKPVQWWIPILNPSVAVFCFYMISGFLIAMVINETYRDRVAAFYSARALRIFPLYFVILIATIALYSYFGRLTLFTSPAFSGLEKAWLAFVNVILLGTDFIPFLGGDFARPETRIVVIAWTLSIELQFYLVAPFIVLLRLRWCALLLVALLALRWSMPLHSSWWNYFFAPAVWCFFVMGVLGYKALVVIPAHWRSPLLVIGAGLVLSIAAATNLQTPSVALDSALHWAFYVTFALTIPLLFWQFKSSKLDSAVGSVSYPLYLCHLLIYSLMTRYSGAAVAATVCGVTLLLCAIDSMIRTGARARVIVTGTQQTGLPGRYP